MITWYPHLSSWQVFHCISGESSGISQVKTQVFLESTHRQTKHSTWRRFFFPVYFLRRNVIYFPTERRFLYLSQVFYVEIISTTRNGLKSLPQILELHCTTCNKFFLWREGGHAVGGLHCIVFLPVKELHNWWCHWHLFNSNWSYTCTNPNWFRYPWNIPLHCRISVHLYISLFIKKNNPRWAQNGAQILLCFHDKTFFL